MYNAKWASEVGAVNWNENTVFKVLLPLRRKLLNSHENTSSLHGQIIYGLWRGDRGSSELDGNPC